MSRRSKRLSILLNSEITELYSPPKLSIEQQRVLFALNDNEMQVFQSMTDRHLKVYFVLLLGYFKNKPVMLDVRFSQVRNDFYFVRDDYLPGVSLGPHNLTVAQKRRIYQRIFVLVDHRTLDGALRDTLESKALELASISVEPRYIFDECISFLTDKQIAIPKYTVLQRLVSTVVNTEKVRLQNIIRDKLSDPLHEFMRQLLNTHSSVPLSGLRNKAKDFTAPEMQKELTAFRYIQPHRQAIDSLVEALQISGHNIDYYASMVDYYTATKLRRFDSLTATLYLLCYLHKRQVDINERLADGFIFHVRRLNEQAKMAAKETSFKEWTTAAANVGKAGNILLLFIDNQLTDTTPFGVIKKKAFSWIAVEDIEPLSRYLRDQRHALDHYIWTYYDRQVDVVQGLLRQLFLALHFQSDNQNALLAQVNMMQQVLGVDRQLTCIDRRLIKSQHKPYVINHDQRIDGTRFEMMIYLLLKDKLEAKDVYVQNTLKYRPLSDDLVDDDAWNNRDHLITESRLARLQSEPQALMDQLTTELNDRINTVGERIRNGDNHSVIMRNRTGKTAWRLPHKGVKNLLNNPFFEQLQPTHIGDLLRYVDRETGFLDCFEHIRGVQARDAAIDRHLLAGIIANGTNYGLYKMAAISDCAYEPLRQTQANYIRLETLNRANDCISNAIAKLPIFEHYNIQDNALHASADGQKFECRLNTFKTRFSSKYFGMNKGVSAMTLVANHVPINAKLIGANEHESHFIFDLLYNNTSQIKPDMLSTDTHGVNHVNFALLDFFGYTFAPRYAQFGRVINELFVLSDNEDIPMLTLRKPIDNQCAINGWESIQRIIISLQNKTTTQATIVRKLSGYRKHHPLLRALTEYDRLIKARYLLEYIDDASLRHYVQRALNRGEAYHQLRRAVSSVNGNRFRGGSDGEIDLWNECARLLTNAIIYFNSLILSKLLDHYTRWGNEKMIELTKQVSPVAWVNVNLNGTYRFSFDGKVINLDELLAPLTSK